MEDSTPPNLSVPFSYKSWVSLLDDLRPTGEELAQWETVHRELKEHLLEHCSLKVVDVWVCGSSSKGTALRGRNELDIVVVIQQFKSLKSLAIEEALEKCLMKKSNLGDVAQIKKSKWKVSFIYRKAYRIDLVAAGPPPFTSGNATRSKSFISIRDWEEREKWQASVCDLQREFIQRQPLVCKDVIRILKYWRNFGSGELRNLKSYLLELVVVYVYLFKTKDAERKGIEHILIQSLDLLQHPETLQVIHEDHYSAKDVPHWTKKRNEGWPLVLCVSNPTDNVARCISLKGWKGVSEEATKFKRTLQPK